MSTFWHKPAYTPSDRDETGEIRADALRPGIYCEDQAALDQLRRGARVRSREMTPTLDGAWRLDGTDVYLCTPEQAAILRATATVTPEESLAEQRRQDEFADELWRATVARAADVLLGDTYGPDGKVEVAGKQVRLSRIGVPEYARHVARRTETEVEFTATLRQTTPAVRALTGMRESAGPNRRARRAAAAQARRGA